MDQVTLDRWNASEKPGVYRVSELSALITSLLCDDRLSKIWVTGEITNFKRHSSGHLYFSLSDQTDQKEAVVSCSIWKSAARYLPFTPEDGMGVQAYGTISHYEAGGRYSFQITQMRPSGAGEKALLIERWKREMSEKGWFSQERKRAVPKYPVRIGVVTSPTGAVIHDIRKVISGRFPAEIILSPAAVQGPTAYEDISVAIKRVEGLVDVVIVARGGGSYEDLFSFNHPSVVEAIVTCRVPVIAAIGHEVDVTLADLAADIRASTPSHAAEQCVPDRESELEFLRLMRHRMFQRLISRVESFQEEINELRDRLSPRRMYREIGERREYLADITDRFVNAGTMVKNREKFFLDGLKERLEGKNPRMLLIREIPERRSLLAELSERLQLSIRTHVERDRFELDSLRAILAAQGPEAAFRKGYCLVQKNGILVTTADSIQSGDTIQVRFSDGKAEAEVKEVYHDEEV